MAESIVDDTGDQSKIRQAEEGIAPRSEGMKASEASFTDSDKESRLKINPDADTKQSQQPTEVWYQEDEGWELTWPIWHMLSRDERKAIAQQHGYSTIGAFEEFMVLQRAVGDSALEELQHSEQKAYENNLAYPIEVANEIEEPTAATETPEGNEEADEDDELDVKVAENDTLSDGLTPKELYEVGGKILMLPPEMIHRIFDLLPVDQFPTLALVSPHWKKFTRTEAVYRRLCERLYLQQSKRRVLQVSRFGNSYRSMLEKRPRVRTGGGCYTIKYARVKPIQRDMWTEVSLSRGQTRLDFVSLLLTIV